MFPLPLYVDMALRGRLSIRVTSAVTALVVVGVYGYLAAQFKEKDAVLQKTLHTPSDDATVNIPTRHLLSYHNNGYHSDANHSTFEEFSKGDNESGCRDPLHPPAAYGGDSCQYVRDACSGQTMLINYLSFIMCDMGHLKVRTYACI